MQAEHQDPAAGIDSDGAGQPATVKELTAKLAAVTAELETLKAQPKATKQRHLEKELRRTLDSETDAGLYDMVVDVGDIRGLFGDGARVLLGPGAQKFFGKSPTAAKVSVLGNFNVGKTFVLTRIGELDLPAGTVSHTRGISVKLVNLAKDGEQFALFIDTVGRNSPAPDPKEGTELPEVLQLQKALEETVKQYVLGTADVFLFVVGQLSASDQLELYLLYQALLERRRRGGGGHDQRVIVVHNLQHWSADMVGAEKYPERIQKIFKVSKGMTSTLEVERDGALVYLTGTVASESAADGVLVQHFFLTDDFEEGNANGLVYERLRGALKSGTAGRPVDACAELAHSLEHWLPSYVTVPNNEEAVARFTEVVASGDGGGGSCRLKMVTGSSGERIAAEDVVARNRSLGSVVSLPADEPAYNLTMLDSRHVALCIEVPGLDVSSVDCYFGCVDATSNELMRGGDALTEGGRRTVLRVWVEQDWKTKANTTHVHLQGALASVTGSVFGGGAAPPAAAEEVEMAGFVWSKQGPARLALAVPPPGEEALRVTDSGSRAVKEGAARRPVALHRAFSEGELNWKFDTEPQFTQADGVLCVVFELNALRVRKAGAKTQPVASAPPPLPPAPKKW